MLNHSSITVELLRQSFLCKNFFEAFCHFQNGRAHQGIAIGKIKDLLHFFTIGVWIVAAGIRPVFIHKAIIITI